MPKQQARKCVFCGGTPVTREHLFPQSWRDKVNVPDGAREFIRTHKGDRATRTESPVPFDVVVRRVCKTCNETWMQLLDRHVMAWVVNSEAVGTAVDPLRFRRWAIKVAMLRTTLDHPNQLPRKDIQQLYAGDDVTDWRVFIGKSAFADLADAFAGTGGNVTDDGELTDGVMQVSWCLGTAVVVCVREVGVSQDLFTKGFRGFCRQKGQLAQVLPSATKFPTVSLLRPIQDPGEMLAYFWYFSPDPLSPISETVRRLQNTMRARNIELGNPEYGD